MVILVGGPRIIPPIIDEPVNMIWYCSFDSSATPSSVKVKESIGIGPVLFAGKVMLDDTFTPDVTTPACSEDSMIKGMD